jgi:hypothetical protein
MSALKSGAIRHNEMEDGSMSWDISIMDLPTDADSLSDIPDDFQPEPLGARTDLIAAIREVAPSSNFTNPSWGQLVTPDFVIEFNMVGDEIVDSIMLHVRGGDSAVDFIAALLDRLGRRAIDCSEGSLFDPSASEQSFRAWRDFRDRVIEG